MANRRMRTYHTQRHARTHARAHTQAALSECPCEFPRDTSPPLRPLSNRVEAAAHRPGITRRCRSRCGAPHSAAACEHCCTCRALFSSSLASDACAISRATRQSLAFRRGSTPGQRRDDIKGRVEVLRERPCAAATAGWVAVCARRACRFELTFIGFCCCAMSSWICLLTNSSSSTVWLSLSSSFLMDSHHLTPSSGLPAASS